MVQAKALCQRSPHRPVGVCPLFLFSEGSKALMQWLEAAVSCYKERQP